MPYVIKFSGTTNIHMLRLGFSVALHVVTSQKILAGHKYNICYNDGGKYFSRHLRKHKNISHFIVAIVQQSIFMSTSPFIIER